MYVLTEYVLTESFIMDWIGEKFGYWRQVRLIREYVLSRVRLNRVLLYLHYVKVDSEIYLMDCIYYVIQRLNILMIYLTVMNQLLSFLLPLLLSTKRIRLVPKNLYIIPKGRTVTSIYYMEVIFKQSLTTSMLRTRDSGTILERKLLAEWSKAIFDENGSKHIPPKEARMAKNTMPGPMLAMTFYQYTKETVMTLFSKF